MSQHDYCNFVLVHGAWHGGWCWHGVAETLRERGHCVTTPTQTGLGERSHLLSPAVDFNTFVQDLTNHLLFENLREAVLVGHSFGANVVAATVDRLPGRVARLIFLDGFLPESGRSAFEQLPADITRRRILAAQQSSGGLTIPIPDVVLFGLKDDQQQRDVADRLTPHPMQTYQTKIRLDGPLGNGVPCDYIQCTRPRYPGTENSLAAVHRRGWPVHELAYGHDAMLEAPVATADLLESIALSRGLHEVTCQN